MSRHLNRGILVYTFKNLAVSAMVLFIGASAHAGALRCEKLFQRSEAPALVPHADDLLARSSREGRQMSEAEIKRLNDEMYNSLVDYRPPENSSRARSITMQDAQSVLDAIRSNEVTGSYGVYDQPDVSIGYCFGRASFAHLMLLKMGVQKESIFKMWAVGPMKVHGSDTLTWQFHVTPVVFTRDMGWVALDTNERRPQKISHWISKYEAQSTDKKMRFYLSDASKFGVNMDRYTRVQMGLDLARENDWYKGYFQDMLRQLRLKTLSELGVHAIAPEGPRDRDTFVVEKRAVGVVGRIRDFFGF